MHRRLLLVLAFGQLAAAVPGVAQSLAARPTLFVDPVAESDPTHRPLVLGRTTLTAALRIFAAELAKPVRVRVPLRRPSNPDTLPRATEWQVGDQVVRPRYRLNPGPGFYDLFFDENQRLITASTFELPRPVHRQELVAHYPKLQFERRRDNVDFFVAPLGPCVSLAGRLRLETNAVDQLTYVYTCATKPGRPPRG